MHLNFFSYCFEEVIGNICTQLACVNKQTRSVSIMMNPKFVGFPLMGKHNSFTTFHIKCYVVDSINFSYLVIVCIVISAS